MIQQIIKDLRSKHGLTLSMFAERTGLSVSFISDMERGRTQGSIETWQKIADAFGLNLVIRLEDKTGEDATQAIQREKAKRYDVLKDMLEEIVQEMGDWRQ